MADDHGAVIILEGDEQWASLLQNPDKAIIVDFTATWCGPCRAIAPIFVQLSAKYPSVVFVKIDVDKFKEISEAAGIRVMPTFQVYKGGKKVETMEGANPEGLEALIAKYA